jgi:hypothetical protein
MSPPAKPPRSVATALERLLARAPRGTPAWVMGVLGAPSTRGRRTRDLAPLVGLWVAVAAYYVFVISAGHFTRWHVWSALYDAQAEGLLHGHLHLPEAPSRALTALANPYDIANIQFWRWDHSYYQGHLYLYWGLVPAFIAAAIKAIFHAPGVPDNTLTFAFCMIRLVAGTLLIRDVARTADRRPPRWAVALAMLVFALANPTPYTLARAGIYEAAIMGGVAFTVAGLWFGHRALGARRAGAATAWLAAASFSLGLAGGTRLSLIPTIAALAALTGGWRLWQLHRRGARDRNRARIAVAAAALLPAGAIGLGLLVCNHLRFGNWLEFGRSYVMTYPFFLPGFRFLPPDLYAYTIAPPRFTCWFPFLSSGWNTLRPSVPAWLPVGFSPDHHSAEPTVGLLAAAPFTVLAPVALAAAFGRARLRQLVGDASRWMTRMNWLWAALAIYVAGAAPFLILNVTTMRYEHDFASGVLLLAIFGSWRLLATPSSARGRRATAWAYGLLATSTIVAGVLLGFGGYFRHFEQHNPALLRSLVAALSVCR